MINEEISIEGLNWEKVGGLIPAVIQDAATLQVLMLGYMNKKALQKTIETGKITFFSRTKERLWTKGELSGNDLSLVSMIPDCDNDTLLVQVKPSGPSCHLNNPSCFGTNDAPGLGILAKLEAIIEERHQKRPTESYISKLFNDGINRIAQKVGEEGVEVALAGVTESKDATINESADLIFHLLLLLKARGIHLREVLLELTRRTD